MPRTRRRRLARIRRNTDRVYIPRGLRPWEVRDWATARWGHVAFLYDRFTGRLVRL